MILDERDVFKLFAKSLNEFGGRAPSPPSLPAAPPPVDDEEQASRRKRLARVAASKRGRQSLVHSGVRGDTSVAPVFGASLTGSAPSSQTLG